MVDVKQQSEKITQRKLLVTNPEKTLLAFR